MLTTSVPDTCDERTRANDVRAVVGRAAKRTSAVDMCVC
jgi:hypothetical protein